MSGGQAIEDVLAAMDAEAGYLETIGNPRAAQVRAERDRVASGHVVVEPVPEREPKPEAEREPGKPAEKAVKPPRERRGGAKK